MNIDFSKAPKDATHYREDPGAENFARFYRANPAKLWAYYPIDKTWSRCPYGIVPGVVLPIPDTWREGALPPVGTKCQHTVLGEFEAWRDVEIIAHHRFGDAPHFCAVFVYEDQVSYSSAGDHFRPKTSEVEIAGQMLEDSEPFDLTMFQCLHLVKRGWRK